ALAFGRSLRLDRAGEGSVALGPGLSLDEHPAGTLPAPARLSRRSALELLVRYGRATATRDLAAPRRRARPGWIRRALGGGPRGEGRPYAGDGGGRCGARPRGPPPAASGLRPGRRR